MCYEKGRSFNQASTADVQDAEASSPEPMAWLYCLIYILCLLELWGIVRNYVLPFYLPFIFIMRINDYAIFINLLIIIN